MFSEYNTNYGSRNLNKNLKLLKPRTKYLKYDFSYCPFRGCAGDWVKLGVAKRRGAVLRDAVSKMADESTKVQLVESDIPGAELPKPAEFCTVAVLKRWLSCRGAKVSGNRKDLIKRLDYEPCNVNYFETFVTFAIEVICASWNTTATFTHFTSDYIYQNTRQRRIQANGVPQNSPMTLCDT